MTRGRPRDFDIDQALDTAMRLFWRHGYEGASIAMLARAMGINPPSLYAAFGDKRGLFERAIAHYGAMNGHMYANALALPKARDVARAILEGEVELVTRDACPDGCLVVQGALVTGPDAEPVQRFMAEVRAVPVIWMTDRFQRAIDDGDLPPDADPKALALHIMTVNCGLAVMARSGADRPALLAVVDIAMRGWPA